MKHLTRWLLALLAVATVASLSGAWTAPQEQGKEGGKQEKQAGQPGRKGKGRAEKLAALKAAVPTLKTSLTESIALAEKELKGTAIASGLEIVNGKSQFQVTLVLNDELVQATVNTETKKVMLSPASQEGVEKDEKEPAGGK